jgi:hypothetical protein
LIAVAPPLPKAAKTPFLFDPPRTHCGSIYTDFTEDSWHSHCTKPTTQEEPHASRDCYSGSRLCLRFWDASAGLAADDIEPGTERVSLAVGAFLTNFDANLLIDGSSLARGTRLNLRDDLGVDRQQSGIWAGVEWRFSRKQRIAVDYTRFTPGATTTLTHPIQIGDVVYPTGATLSTELNMEIVPFTYSYSFIKRENDEFAGTIGVNWNRLDFDAHGSVGLTSLPGSGLDVKTTANANFPLPLFGLRYGHHFSQRWSVGLEAAGFVLKVAEGTFNIRGDLWNARGQVEYRFAKHFAAVAAVDAFSIDVDANKTDWNGSIGYRFWGPQFFLKARF